MSKKKEQPSEYYKELKAKLPTKYASIIAAKLLEREDVKIIITQQQIRSVLNEQCQDPTIILPVLEESRKLADQMDQVQELKTRRL